jgi:hypothetical protein
MNTPQINNGGPVYPCKKQIRSNGEIIATHKYSGMSLRDLFAAQALMGIINHPAMHPDDASKLGCALLAYEYADAMVQAREVKP